MNINLEGSYAFDGDMDYTLGFAMRDLRSTEEGQFGPIEDDGLGQQFFIQMHGNVASPDYRWDPRGTTQSPQEQFSTGKGIAQIIVQTFLSSPIARPYL